MSDKIIYIEGVGDVNFVKSKKAKHLRITVRSFHRIKVSVPANVSFNTAKYFVNEKKHWINKHKEKLKDVRPQHRVFIESTDFKTKNHTLKISCTNEDNISVNVSNTEILVGYPFNCNVKDEPVQLMIRKGIEKVLKIEAKEYIPARTTELAKANNFEFNKVYIKNNKSRWGSCSHLGNLNFSFHLMMLPDELIDYVILHELTHTVEHNHSRKFWTILDSIYGDSKAIDKKLKNYRIGF